MSEPDLMGCGESATDQPHPAWGEAETRCFEVETDDRNWRERIEQLEQALEQSLASISELRLQLKDQHLLESQLAATEEMANLQQQAINELQRQVTQQQQAIEFETVAKHSQDRVFEDFLKGIESLTQAQQLQIERLRARLDRGHTVVQFERHAPGQNLLETRLQHAYEELQADRNRCLARLTQIEQETTVLQEQLLQQAQQAEEYEAAVHYWKERYSASIDQVLHLKEALESHLQNPSADLSALLTALQPMLTTEAVEPVIPERLPLPSLKHQPLQVDLPNFLTRRRRD